MTRRGAGGSLDPVHEHEIEENPMTVVAEPTRCRPAQSEGYTVTAVLLLILGGFLVPFLGWFAGVVMLWAGPRWGAAEKWLGTLVWPAVLALPLGVWLGVAALTGRAGPGLLVGTAVGVVTVLVGLPWAFVRLLRAARR
ncbi:hypothetical protein [Actinomycetospora sp. NBRC 106378]|jgi:hypothetical protein|uniref:hypothetical protein n=1 Tax=Actinomycetospora sp. NBRC 106378 TaxID=3032208 RepID=UPI002554A58C|nr:hypothetical protein [Actinomycetospora sp. NBRC 106378]